MRRISCITVDLDPVQTYLQNRGLEPRPGTNLNAVIEDGLPRFLEVFQALGVRATLFAVGRDAQVEANAAVLRQAAAQGHEIANHSHSHPRNFAGLRGDTLLREVADAEQALSRAAGTPIRGFRAPGWNVSPDLFALLADRGYRYDSSLVPLPLSRLLGPSLQSKTRFLPANILYNQLAWPNPPPKPYRLDPDRPWKRGSSLLWEIPSGFCTLPPVPLNCTVAAMLGDGISGLLEQAAALSPHPLVYIFHGLDLVDFHRQIKDPRLGKKPGLTDPLELKLDRVKRILDNLGRGRRWTLLNDMVGGRPGLD